MSAEQLNKAKISVGIGAILTGIGIIVTVTIQSVKVEQSIVTVINKVAEHDEFKRDQKALNAAIFDKINHNQDYLQGEINTINLSIDDLWKYYPQNHGQIK